MSVDKQDLDTAYGRRENDPIVSGDKLFLGDKAGADWAEVVSYKWKGSRNPVEDEDYYRVTTMVHSEDLTTAAADVSSRRQEALPSLEYRYLRRLFTAHSPHAKGRIERSHGFIPTG